MIENSKDILYIVISFCILWATVFLCWMFYYAGKILKNTSQIIEEFRVRLQALAEAISYIQEKIEYISLAMSSAFKGVGATARDAMMKKAKSWMEKKSDNYGGTAKMAVDKAMEMTANKMRKMAKKIKK
jgi:hypothetical protein